jgi:hypothetical protein
MRVLAACLVGFLGLGALATMAACSDSTDAGMGGAGGASTAAAGSGGKAAAGGAPSCTFLSDACTMCIQGNCAALLNTCGTDDTCQEALGSLTVCACNPSMDAMDCQAKFATDGGDKALKLIECYSLNSCDDVCQ